MNTDNNILLKLVKTRKIRYNISIGTYLIAGTGKAISKGAHTNVFRDRESAGYQGMTGTELLQNALRAADRRKENFTKDADEWRRETRRIFRLREKVSDLRRSIRSAEPPRLYGDTYDGRCGDVESALRAAAGLLDSMHDIARANAAFYSERAGI